MGKLADVKTWGVVRTDELHCSQRTSYGSTSSVATMQQGLQRTENTASDSYQGPQNETRRIPARCTGTTQTLELPRHQGCILPEAVAGRRDSDFAKLKLATGGDTSQRHSSLSCRSREQAGTCPVANSHWQLLRPGFHFWAIVRHGCAVLHPCSSGPSGSRRRESRLEPMTESPPPVIAIRTRACPPAPGAGARRIARGETSVGGWPRTLYDISNPSRVL
jgi:hypothetical protein